ncbi:MAG: hypothetical protein JSV31_19250 [Desulfobacterales bacterium]|nr:MAG: hypothetical protein JSV31_19250 [Desulfobacterales bacterium]
MSGQLAVPTALRAIRSELDECERGSLGVKNPDEILSKYLEWVSTELVDETISILANVENHSIVKLVAENHEITEREAFWFCLGLSMGANIGECLGEYPKP